MLTVFHDTFHSGFYVPAADLPFDMRVDDRVRLIADPAVLEDGPPRTEFVEVGFSNVDWFLHENRTCLKVVRLLVLPDDGTILVTNLDRDTYRDVRAKGRVWRIPISEPRYRDFLTELRSWVDLDGASYVAQVGDIRAECYSSKYSYSMRSNCHDWTTHMLQAAGIPMAWRFYRRAADLEVDLDAAIGQPPPTAR